MCVIDFHTHILPNIDDGSRTVSESVAMLDALAKQSVNTVIATPHFYANDQSVDGFLENRNSSYEALKNDGKYSQNIVLGAEVRYYDGISHLSDLKKLRIDGTRFLLLEMPFSKWTNYEVNEIIDIASRGKVTLVLAHIDRYLPMLNNNLLMKLLSHGVLFQVNASSFSSLFSSLKIIKLLKINMVHFSGSDCHNTTDRSPNISVAAKMINKRLGGGAFEEFIDFSNDLFVQNKIV